MLNPVTPPTISQPENVHELVTYATTLLTGPLKTLSWNSPGRLRCFQYQLPWTPCSEARRQCCACLHHNRASVSWPYCAQASGSVLCFSHYVVADSCNSMDYSRPGSSVHVIFLARMLEWAAISFSRGSSWARDRTCISCTAGRFFTPGSPRKPD